MFRNFYRRCQYYGYFLAPTTTWDTSASRGFINPETTGLKRDPQTLAADLDGFLDCIGSYTPFDYLGEKLKKESTNIDTVWELLYEVYDVEINTTNFMDYALMRREPEESYRGFYNRLVGYMRQHLPKTSITAEGIRSPTTGEDLTIALLDSVAIHWLLCIDPRLIGIVKTEFATELKSLRLSQMVKTIAKNIDELLVRYNTKDQVHMIQNSPYKPTSPALIAADRNSSSDMQALVQRIERLETGKQQFQKQANRRFRKKEQCSHCVFLNKQLGSNLRTDHFSGSCGKKGLSVNLVEAFEPDNDSEIAQDNVSEYEGLQAHEEKLLISSLQTTDADSSERQTVQSRKFSRNLMCLNSDINQLETYRRL